MNYEDMADFLLAFAPFGTGDIEEAIERGKDVLGLDASEVGELIRQRADELCYEKYDDVDPIAMVNDEIKAQAVQNFNDLTSKIDWENVEYEDHESGEDELTGAIDDIYFFGNYIDCPLQYTNEAQEAVDFFMTLVNDDLIDKYEIGIPLRFIIGEMGFKLGD